MPRPVQIICTAHYLPSRGLNTEDMNDVYHKLRDDIYALKLPPPGRLNTWVKPGGPTGIQVCFSYETVEDSVCPFAVFNDVLLTISRFQWHHKTILRRMPKSKRALEDFEMMYAASLIVLHCIQDSR
jgi:hypothetical protein